MRFLLFSLLLFLKFNLFQYFQLFTPLFYLVLNRLLDKNLSIGEFVQFVLILQFTLILQFAIILFLILFLRFAIILFLILFLRFAMINAFLILGIQSIQFLQTLRCLIHLAKLILFIIRDFINFNY